MKKLFQFVALLVVLLLATQPLLANSACAQPRCGGDHSTAECCNHTGSMAMSDSAMPSMSMSSMAAESAQAMAVCSYDSCCVASDHSSVQMATSPKDQFTDNAVLLAPVTSFSMVPDFILTARSSEGAPVPAASRQVLFQVFRI